MKEKMKRLPRTQEEFAKLYNTEGDSFGIYKGKKIIVYVLNDSYFAELDPRYKDENFSKDERINMLKEFYSKLNRLKKEGYQITVREHTAVWWDAKIEGIKFKPTERKFNILSDEFTNTRAFLSKNYSDKIRMYDFLSIIGFRYIGGEGIVMTHYDYRISISLKKDMSFEEFCVIITQSIYQSGQENKAAEIRNVLGVFDTSGYSAYDYHKYID